MPEPERLILVPPPDFRSREAGSFITQMDDLSKNLAEDTRDLTPEEIGWQPARGMNTIGMLLAHMAIVEVFWTGIVLENRAPDAVPYADLLGIGEDDDGMPIQAGGTPPAHLAGKDLAFFVDLLDRARAHLRSVARMLADAALDREVTKVRANGQLRLLNGRWALYHMLEHYAGHSGQILLLRHQWRAKHPRA
jgi:uncharacterized damage-inducible protein DinB